MNYTEIYRKVYNSLKNDDTPHRQAHEAALKITDSITYLSLTSRQQEEVLLVIKDVVSNLATSDIID